MKFITEGWARGKKIFSSFAVFIYIAIGIIFLVTSFIWLDEHNFWYKIFYTVGTTMLAGGVFASIAKSTQFSDIFSKILRDIIYGHEHLETRKDLEKIWENVTHTLSNKKFMKISDQMGENIKKYFLPLHHDYYYDNYTLDIVIEMDPKNDGYIRLKETIKYDIICDDEKLNIDIRIRRGIRFDIMNKDLTKYYLRKILVNEKEYKPSLDNTTNKNEIWVGYNFKLNGSKKYSIKREEEIIYALKFNNLKQHLAIWLYNGFNLSISYPHELYIEFNSLGTLNDYNIEFKKNKLFNRFEAIYKGLIYKNQGFFLHICKRFGKEE